MYQNCCNKCGSMSLHTEEKGNNIGLYCDDCGAWIKWLGKDELRAFKHSKNTNSDDESENDINNVMKVFLLKIPADNWSQDYAMVVIAKDKENAEKQARLASDDFKRRKTIKVKEINLNEDRCVLIANTGA